jgi:microsomal dipeptidase-like Zn-dependent dipeptidase
MTGTRCGLGVGSDFDGIKYPAIGLEDVSTVPSLSIELLRRGYSDLVNAYM